MTRYASALAALLLLLSASLAFGASASTHTKVKTRHVKLGKILVTKKGMSLYLFQKDKKGPSKCYKACAKGWPPLLTKGKPVAGKGVKASLLGTTKRKNGKKQVTYGGHPLYRYVLDSKPGQTRGQGSHAFGANWYVVAPNGHKIDND